MFLQEHEYLLMNIYSNIKNNIKTNITYYSKNDIEESLETISIFKKLLNNLPLYINVDEDILNEIPGTVIIANYNSENQLVISGESKSIQNCIEKKFEDSVVAEELI